MSQSVQQHNTALRRSAAEPETAVLISPNVRHGLNSHPRQQETIALVLALKLHLLRVQKTNLSQVHPGHYLQSGVIERLEHFIAEFHPDLLILDCPLSAVQQRNLEKILQVRVLERYGLILEIFAKRARSHEGRLQVELARLKYQESRLIRSWTHLERQRGGLGKVGGPGESQLELDRRLLREQIIVRERKIVALKRRRALQRRRRERRRERSVAIVGYTNAGKTTLFNRLTGAEQQAGSRVFETLDTTMRRWTVAPGTRVILSDTVGFIDDLPPDLIHAFRATLEEVLYADVLLHLHDCRAPEAHKTVVREIMSDILDALDPEERPTILTVYNKCEDISAELLEQWRDSDVVAISGQGGWNLEVLARRIHQQLEGEIQVRRWTLPANAGEQIAWLYRHGRVLHCDGIVGEGAGEGEGIVIEAQLSQEKIQKFEGEILSPPKDKLLSSWSAQQI